VRRHLQRERKSRDAAAEDEKIELFHTENLADKYFNTEKNQEQTKKNPCKSVEQEEHNENGSLWSWARNQMGNIK
jgi:hypothetical protein